MSLEKIAQLNALAAQMEEMKKKATEFVPYVEIRGI